MISLKNDNKYKSILSLPNYKSLAILESIDDLPEAIFNIFFLSNLSNNNALLKFSHKSMFRIDKCQLICDMICSFLNLIIVILLLSYNKLSTSL